MLYKELKSLQAELKNTEAEEVTLEKTVVIEIIDEVLLMRRRNTARIRQNLSKQDKVKENMVNA